MIVDEVDSIKNCEVGQTFLTALPFPSLPLEIRTLGDKVRPKIANQSAQRCMLFYHNFRTGLSSSDTVIFMFTGYVKSVMPAIEETN
jgi:hypothetical protein